MTVQYERLVAPDSPHLHEALEARFDEGGIGSVDVLAFERTGTGQRAAHLVYREGT